MKKTLLKTMALFAAVLLLVGPGLPRALAAEIPTDVSASGAGPSEILLSWNSVTGAQQYTVYRALNPDGPFSVVAFVTGTYYRDTGLTANTGYYYLVSATVSGEESNPAGPVYAKTDVMPAPPVLTAKAESADNISLRWSEVAGANTYYVFRTLRPLDGFSYIAAAASRNYADNGLSARTTYYYYVVAYVGGQVVMSNTVSATTLPVAPASPGGLLATATGSDTILVEWSAAANANGYIVYRSMTQNGTYSQIADTADVRITDTGLSPNTTYYYKVVAYNAGGQSESVGPASATTFRLTYMILASASVGGTIEPGGEIVVEAGGSAAFVFSPAAGYEVDNIVIDGEPVEADSMRSAGTYTFENVWRQHTIYVTFRGIPATTEPTPPAPEPAAPTQPETGDGYGAQLYYGWAALLFAAVWIAARIKTSIRIK